MVNLTTQTVLFWNLHEKPLYDSIVSLCHSRDVDFLLLAESTLDGVQLLEALNRGKSNYWPIHAQKGDLAVFARHPPLTAVKYVDIPKLDQSDRIKPSNSNVLFFRIRIGPDPFNLVLVHLRSQMRGKPIDWGEGIRNVNARIRLFEKKKVKNDRTIVVGDFNMNPFDEGLVAASGFHAMMTRDLATEKGRFVDHIQHPFFYNPMWGRFGCEKVTGRPPGTFYYDKAENVRYYWNLFDQVLIRPSMLNHFRDEDLELIVHDGQSPLRKNLKPDVDQFSDHLPILFKLNF
jgi:hypothetical protein